MPREEERHESWAATSEIARTNADHRVIYVRARAEQCRLLSSVDSWLTLHPTQQLKAPTT
jgi:hypothetical protein